MNQGIAFARTLRALEADGFRASKLGLTVGALVIGAWTWWMFAARLPQYESSSDVHIESGRLVVHFSSAALDRIHSGQSAIVHSAKGAVATQVEAIASDHADLVLPANLQAQTVSSVEIEIANVSPASIAFRSIGLR